jgi:DNA repair photolyase
MARRGTQLDPKNRFVRLALAIDEYCHPDENDALSPTKTEWFSDQTQSIVTENQSPDIPFRYSVNPYRGCEHGCAYCYARPTHEYLGWNAGTDFESKILVKSNGACLLREWLCRPTWDGSEHLMLSGVTDPYQPIERRLNVTRSLIEVLCEANQAVSIITKNALVTRDVDLLASLAKHRATCVCMSITTLDPQLASILEPRCSIPSAKLRAIRTLSDAGVPVHVNMAPIIPGLTDHEIPSVLKAVAEAGARSASWILLRLPGAVEPIFVDWLERHFPQSKDKVLHRVRSLRHGKMNDNQFGRRMRGEGCFSDQWSQWFRLMRSKLGLAEQSEPLNTKAFRRPVDASGQRYLF